MTWLNQTLAVPTVGILMESRFRSASSCLDAIEPWVRKVAGPLVKVRNEAYSLRIEANTGFTCAIDNRNVVLGFAYPEARAQEPGELPTLTFGEVRPFDVLLGEVLDHLNEVLTLLDDGTERAVLRVGFLAVSALAEDSAPPGLTEFLGHLARPWARGLTAAEGKLVALLDETESHTDRCHHVVSFDRSERPGDLQLSLDWQRVHTAPQPMRIGEMTSYIRQLSATALTYFDTFAAGDLEYAGDE